MSSEPRRILVAGIGNIFCTDDGFGPAVAAQLLAHASSAPAGARTADDAHVTAEARVTADDARVTVVDYGIRGMHLSYDLLDRPDVLILIDARPDRGHPGQLSVLRIEPDHVPPAAGDGGQLDAHGMDPVTLLSNLVSLGGRLPEVTLLVGCEVADIAEGMGLTPAVAASVSRAADVVQGLLEQSGQLDQLDQLGQLGQLGQLAAMREVV